MHQGHEMSSLMNWMHGFIAESSSDPQRRQTLQRITGRLHGGQACRFRHIKNITGDVHARFHQAAGDHGVHGPGLLPDQPANVGQ